MKRIVYTLIGIIVVSCSIVSCSSPTPAELGKKRAEEWKEACRKGDAEGMDKAMEKFEKGFEKYTKDREAYFEYMDAFKANSIMD